MLTVSFFYCKIKVEKIYSIEETKKSDAKFIYACSTWSMSNITRSIFLRKNFQGAERWKKIYLFHVKRYWNVKKFYGDDMTTTTYNWKVKVLKWIINEKITSILLVQCKHENGKNRRKCKFLLVNSKSFVLMMKNILFTFFFFFFKHGKLNKFQEKTHTKNQQINDKFTSTHFNVKKKYVIIIINKRKKWNIHSAVAKINKILVTTHNCLNVPDLSSRIIQFNELYYIHYILVDFW